MRASIWSKSFLLCWIGDIDVLNISSQRFKNWWQLAFAYPLRLQSCVVWIISILFLKTLVDCILFELLTNTTGSICPNRITPESPNASIVTTFQLILWMDFTCPNHFLHEDLWWWRDTRVCWNFISVLIIFHGPNVLDSIPNSIQSRVFFLFLTFGFR